MCIYVCIYIYIYTHINVHAIHIYIYIHICLVGSPFSDPPLGDGELCIVWPCNRADVALHCLMCSETLSSPCSHVFFFGVVFSFAGTCRYIRNCAFASAQTCIKIQKSCCDRRRTTRRDPKGGCSKGGVGNSGIFLVQSQDLRFR